MKMKFVSSHILNIGHDRSHIGKDPLPADLLPGLQKLVETWDVYVQGVAYIPSTDGTDEATTVVYLFGGDTVDNFAEEAAEYFEQECVALYDIHEGTGKLIGEQAAKWGAFNPKYFKK